MSWLRIFVHWETMDRDERYKRIVLDPLMEAMRYVPKMGTSKNVALSDFMDMYGGDPLYHWIGLDNPLMYVAAKAGGGQTSIYRHLGDGMERIVRAVFMDEYGLDDKQVRWGYKTTSSGGQVVHRMLDARLDVTMITDKAKAARLSEWLDAVAGKQGTAFRTKGVVFEVRQGYKSQDSKRSQGDVSNGGQALNAAYQMAVMVMSTQIPDVIRNRYERNCIRVMTGTLTDDPLSSTFAFFKRIVGYDLAAFFARNSGEFREAMNQILERILETE